VWSWTRVIVNNSYLAGAKLLGAVHDLVALFMKICRFEYHDAIRIGLVTDDALLDLTPFGISQLTPLLEHGDAVAHLDTLARQNVPRVSFSEVRLLAPVERQEVWAAGVTYLRSRAARMEESDFSASAYDKVYAAERPEIFFKSLPEKVVATGEPVGIRSDATWNVPEPELALVMNSRGRIVGQPLATT
jgi:2-dehydro-3-deoxy-D-arabinonate dehydratase